MTNDFCFDQIKIGNSVIIKQNKISAGKGDCILLTGPNGCGKTTLLRLMANILPDYVSCKHVGWKEEWHRIGYVEQAFERSIFPWLKIKTNLNFYNNKNLSSIKDLILDLRNEKGPANKLSGGMKQRLAIAKELALLEGLILLDEPFSSQHRNWYPKILASIQEFCSYGGVVFVATHTIYKIVNGSFRHYDFKQKDEVGGYLIYNIEDQKEDIR